jgi:polysaccharide export outer membrane protein
MAKKKISLLLLFSWSVIAWSQEPYRLGYEDVLQVNFWQEPELNSVVRVDKSGNVSLPIVGEVRAEGLTPTELASEIVGRISFYNPRISQATVLVTQYNSRKVYVLGQVLSPGAYGFESMPTLWEAILKAGGITAEGDMSRVVLIRSDSGHGEIRQLDLATILSRGKLEEIPRLRPGDTVDVPRNAETSAGRAPTSNLLQGAEIFYVYGQVKNPGLYELGGNTDLLKAIILAGGPTPAADLSKVRVISSGEGNSTVLTYDLDKYSRQGTPAEVEIHPREAIMVPPKGGGKATGKKILSLLKETVPIISVAITTYISIKLFRERN